MSYAVNNPNAYGLSGTIVGTGINAVERPSTLTDKAERVCGLSADVAAAVARIEQRLWPSPQAGAPTTDAVPMPNAAPWMLESAEQYLNVTLKQLSSIESRL